MTAAKAATNGPPPGWIYNDYLGWHPPEGPGTLPPPPAALLQIFRCIHSPRPQGRQLQPFPGTLPESRPQSPGAASRQPPPPSNRARSFPIMEITPAVLAIQRDRAHKAGHRGQPCPLLEQSWPWQPNDCPVLRRINRLMPIGDADRKTP